MGDSRFFERHARRIVQRSGGGDIEHDKVKWGNIHQAGLRAPVGDPVDSDFDRFLREFRRRAEHPDGLLGKIVLLSTVLPTTFLELDNPEFGSGWITPLSRQMHSLSSEIGKEIDARLDKPLDSHIFPRLLFESVAEYLGERGRFDHGAACKELERRLTTVTTEARPETVVRFLVSMLKSEGAKEILGLLSFFHAPVDEEVIVELVKALRSDKSKGAEPARTDKLKEQLSHLEKLGFLIKTDRADGTRPYAEYSSHPVVRVYFGHQADRMSDSTHEPHLFSLSVYAHENNENLFYSNRAHKTVTEILDLLFRHVKTLNEKSTPQIYVRAIFNLLRFNWSAVTVPRHAVEDTETRQSK